MGSRYHAADEFHDFIQLIKRRGVETILCCGDLSDGLNMHEGMEHEQFLHKPKDILNYLVDNYPDNFKTNVFITGNHDMSLLRSGCLNLGEALVEKRSDLYFVGQDCGMVTVDGGLRVFLYHGSSGCGDMRSKRAQDIALKLAIDKHGDSAHVLATGHCHMENWVPRYMGMSLLSLGCFQYQTPHLAQKLLRPDVSGAILSYQLINDRLINPSLEMIQYAC